MTSTKHEHRMGLLLSGGLDSCILLGYLVRQEAVIQPIFVRSHLIWEQCELAAVERYLAALRQPHLLPLKVLELPADDLYGEHWSVTGENVPDANSPDEAVFLPGRNALLLTKAVIWCSLQGIGELTLAPLGTSPFRDASPAFFDSFEETYAQLGLPRVRIVLPFQRMNKQQVMQLGAQLPLQLTFSCIAPMAGLHCGCCNKCAERKQAFRLVGRPDLTQYANDLR